VRALGDIETDLWLGDFTVLADSHVHRATREDSLSIIKGRDAITAAWVAVEDVAGEVTADLGEMVVVEAAAFGRQRAGDWQLHRWVWREDGRILREIEITNRVRDVTAPPVHPPLGELSAGRGQFASSSELDLPPGFPENARTLTTNVHRKWNGRDFSQNIPGEVAALIKLLPDAVFYFEHAVVTEDASALLFRVMGHHTDGQRIRLIGSMTILGGLADVVIDGSALAAQLDRALINYGSG
jgi:hypothetical protein